MGCLSHGWIFDEIAQEWLRVDDEDHPDVHPTLVDDPHLLRVIHPLPSAQATRRLREMRHRDGFGSWADIASEHLAAAVDSATYGSQQQVRAAVVRLVVAGVGWLAAIDRRPARALEARSPRP